MVCVGCFLVGALFALVGRLGHRTGSRDSLLGTACLAWRLAWCLPLLGALGARLGLPCPCCAVFALCVLSTACLPLAWAVAGEARPAFPLRSVWALPFRGGRGLSFPYLVVSGVTGEASHAFPLQQRVAPLAGEAVVGQHPQGGVPVAACLVEAVPLLVPLDAVVLHAVVGGRAPPAGGWGVGWGLPRGSCWRRGGGLPRGSCRRRGGGSPQVPRVEAPLVVAGEVAGPGPLLWGAPRPPADQAVHCRGGAGRGQLGSFFAGAGLASLPSPLMGRDHCSSRPWRCCRDQYPLPSKKTR